jgi:hypothetical protein
MALLKPKHIYPVFVMKHFYHYGVTQIYIVTKGELILSNQKLKVMVKNYVIS